MIKFSKNVPICTQRFFLPLIYGLPLFVTPQEAATNSGTTKNNQLFALVYDKNFRTEIVWPKLISMTKVQTKAALVHAATR